MFDNKISTPPTGHRLKPGAKVILLLVVGAVLFFGFRTAVSRGWIPAPGIAKALVPSKAALPDLKEAVVANVEPAPFPDATTASVNNAKIETDDVAKAATQASKAASDAADAQSACAAA